MAEITARHFKADFNQLILDESHLADGLRRVGPGLGEPLGDASTIPSHLLALFARKKVKVILSGEGADELFAGYPTYIGNRVAEIYNRIPRPITNIAVKAALKLTPVSMGNIAFDSCLQPSRILSSATTPGSAATHPKCSRAFSHRGSSRPSSATTHSARHAR